VSVSGLELEWIGRPVWTFVIKMNRTERSSKPINKNDLCGL
jgi:hypothetical protein